MITKNPWGFSFFHQLLLVFFESMIDNPFIQSPFFQYPSTSTTTAVATEPSKLLSVTELAIVDPKKE